MAIFRLDENIRAFPPANYAESDGLLAIGGKLSPDWLEAAYGGGIFPWYSENSPRLWWSPATRFVVLPQNFHIPKSVKKIIHQEVFEIRYNTAFEELIKKCASATREPNVEGGTWIVPEMQEAYIAWHKEGYVHSIEAWHEDKLVGGLYGVSIGKMFFGESMFYTLPNASKVAFCVFAEKLFKAGFSLIDCQQETAHLARFGAAFILREKFLEYLEKNKKEQTFYLDTIIE